MIHGLQMEEARNSSNGVPVFPEDIIVEIFSRLPVKILMRFKCVCKYWYVIISSPSTDLVSKHLQNYYHNPKNDDGHLLIHHANQSLRYLNALFPDPTLTDFSYQHLDTPVAIKFILGPCNGIFFLDFAQSTSGALWNPATKECKVLPQYPLEHPLCGKIRDRMYGFGFDSASDAFKVVIINQGYECCPSCSKCSGTFLSQGFVCGSCSDSWIQFDLPEQLWVERNTCYVYLNGLYYWSAYQTDNSDNEFLVSFDMCSNSFNQVVSGPICAKEQTYFGLLIYRDAVAWITSEIAGTFSYLWVLNQDKNGCSWTKQLAIGIPEYHYPVGYWKNDQLILRYMKEITYRTNDGEDYDLIHKLVLYDPSCSSLETWDLGIKLGDFLVVLIYKESLVSIKGKKHSQGYVP